MNITSIKRKKATLDGMANVLNEFLYGVSKGFQDAAFASFSRRRSTVRADIAQSFAATARRPAAAAEGKKTDYLDMLNVPAADARQTRPPGRGRRAPHGAAAQPGSQEGPAAQGRPDVGLREI